MVVPDVPRHFGASIDVAIIGAGPAGLAVGAALRTARKEFVILERSSTVGSSWRGHYERVHLHTVKQWSALPYLQFPASYPRYVPKVLMIEYLERYAERFRLQPRFGETVRSVERTGLGWRVESTSGSVHARRVVVATGLNAKPKIPSVDGLETFSGQVLHSAAYLDAAPFVGRSVLVVGMGNTGAEIALDLCSSGADPSVSVRGGVHMAPRDLFGLPIQLVAAAATTLLPDVVNDAIFPTILDWALGYPAKHGLRRPKEGLLHQIKTRGRIPVLDIGTVRKIADGAIHVVPGLSAVRGRQIVFTNGTTGQFDAIIFATGYEPNYSSFLAGEPTACSDRSGLHFVGFKNPVTGLLREISREALRLAAEVGSR
jgi:cation diffusion facilitator CzcD-associated flavoprotein CzcO